ncbi:hypothetical protein NPIL_98141 [Nephila pilipes]|uniref:Uncharacterized protein n=1 Tax=Nephila pilipes TaxID=299642 RepID=A0A8X6U1D7_NEPPI|nr:hypothetical protein NPIL_98141 [Nephila pilipes]
MNITAVFFLCIVKLRGFLNGDSVPCASVLLSSSAFSSDKGGGEFGCELMFIPKRFSAFERSFILPTHDLRDACWLLSLELKEIALEVVEGQTIIVEEKKMEN